MIDFLFDGPENAPVLMLAPGSDAPMDSEFMVEFTALAVQHGIRIARFEFAYMANRRTTGKKPPPPKAEKLIGEYQSILTEIKAPKFFIGGKSLGGRVASMMADQSYRQGKIAGLVCLGYPFHPPGKPEKLRTTHFENFNCPSLICHGENDVFGKREEVEGYDLPDCIHFHWVPTGNHNLTSLKRSGLTQQQNWRDVASAVAQFMKNQPL